MQNKLKSITIEGFQGIKEEKRIGLDKITALCAPNGTGKSSFINSLIFGLTGNKPDGTLVNNSADYAKVSLNFNNSHTFSRIEGSGSNFPNKFLIDNKSITKKQLEDYLSLELNTDISVAKVVASSDVLNSLTNQEFGSLLMKYLPEELDIEMVLKYFQNSSSIEKDIVRELLPNGGFPLAELDNLYKQLYDRRKILKKEIAKYESIINDFESKVKPEGFNGDLSNIDEKINSLQSQKDLVLKYNDELAKYQNYLNSVKNYKTQYANIEREIQENSANAINHTEESLRILEDSVKSNFDTLNNLSRLIAQSQSDIELYEKGLKSLDQPICPLSKNLVCTTDKTPVRDDIIKNLENSKQIHAQTYDNYVQLKERAEKMNEELKVCLNEKRLYDKNQMLENQLEMLKNNKPVEVKEPVKIDKDINEINREINILNNFKVYSKNLEQINIYKERLTEYNDKLVSYEYLVESFSPKGSVRKAIMEYYMYAFSEPCNEKAKELFDNMNIKFVADKGVDVLVDVDGSGFYLPYKSLSKGERARVTFLIMDMLSSLSGMNIIIMDELSVLDPETFENLINVIVNNQDEYDLCVIACVNHEDNIKILEKFDVNILNI